MVFCLVLYSHFILLVSIAGVFYVIVLKTRTSCEMDSLTQRYSHRSLILESFLIGLGTLYRYIVVSSAPSSKLKTTFELIQLAFVRTVNGCPTFWNWHDTPHLT